MIFGLSSLESFPFYNVKTKKLFDFGYATNGVHNVDMRQAEVWLDIWGRHTANAAPCSDCKRDIKAGDVFGNGHLNTHGFGRFCLDCIEEPKDKIEAWRVTYKMKRKTTKNPSGLKFIHMVAEPEKMNKYLEAVISTYGGITIDKLWPLSPDEKRERLHDHLDGILGADGAKPQALIDLTSSLIP